MYYRVSGEGSPVVVVETDLGTPAAEWWGIQEELSKVTRVLTYDRAGYGWSEFTPQARTSGSIALELKMLLTALGIDEPIVFVGHSQGGLYVNHFARLFPEKVVGAVFVDPLSPNDNRFKNELNASVYAKSGVNKTKALRLYHALCWSGILRLLKPLVTKGPPFRFFKDHLNTERADIIWNHLLLPKTYKTALQEYALAHRTFPDGSISAAGPFPRIPIKIVYHSAIVAINEMEQKRGLGRQDAQKVEALREDLVKEHLKLSPHSEWIVAEKSGHFLHLQEHDLMVGAIRDLVVEARKSSQR
jgi:pimeloyl-ACP methyl ester carboxylesterase